MKKIIALILALSSLITLCACGGGEENKKKTDPNNDFGSEISLLGEDGKSRFTILVNTKEDKNVKNVAVLLGNELRKNVGGIYRVLNASNVKEDKNAYEFLLGSTGRAESIALAEGIEEKEYRVKVMGNKVVVVGGSDAALSRGIGELISAIDYEKKSIPKSLNISKTFGGGESLLVGMANQTTNCIEVYDISSGNMNLTSLVWSNKTTCGAISGFKFRNHPTYGEVIIVVGGVNAEMVSYETKEVLWRTTNSSENSHSIELLPNGVIATGGTVGHDIHFYNLNAVDPTKVILEVPFQDAHGLLWDPKYEVLWAVGTNQLTAFEVTLNADGSVTAVKNEELSYVTPESGLHDLQPYYGNDDWLIISTSTHVYVYDKVNKTVKEAYEGVAGATTDHVKGVGRFLNGDQIYMFYDGGNDNGQGGGWNTTYLTYIPNGAKIIGTVPSNMGRFYKCRVWYSNYQ
ncbi:MAG: hypothetical protein IJ404_05195 [Clostridia bacterium]|nr:hypothetical protein [Clostridia bacterium]